MTAIAVSACATMRDSVLTGVGVGAIGGAAVGSLVDKEDSSGTWKGAVIGGVVGALTGYFIHKGLDDRDAKTRKDTLFNLERYNVSRPNQDVKFNYTISAPSVETECFETQVRGNKLIQAHCESAVSGTPEWVANPPKRDERKSKNDDTK